MSTTANERHRTMDREVAEQLAATWERHRPEIETIAAPVREWLVGELRPAPGDTLLELAAGTGDTGFDAAERIGDDGRLLSTDCSPAMVEAARRRGTERGIGNAAYEVVDAHEIPLADGAVDGALCRFGYMLMADPAAALTETRRVLRPGGRLTLAVWGPPERNPFFSAIAMVCMQRGHMPPPDPQAPGIFSMAASERITALLRAAGFSAARVKEIPVRFDMPSVEAYVDFVADTAGPLAMALRALPDDERDAVRAHAGAALESFRVGAGLALPGVALCAVAD